MHHEIHRAELAVCWLAVLLVSGEFAWALMDFWREGRGLAIYLAIDAVVRETRSGARYQEIFMIGVHRVVRLCRRLPVVASTSQTTS
jgi:hypothetical protein